MELLEEVKRRGFSNNDTVLARNMKAKRILSGKKGGISLEWKEEKDTDKVLWVCRAQKSFALLASRTTGINSKATEEKKLCAVERHAGSQVAMQKILKAQVNFWTNKS